MSVSTNILNDAFNSDPAAINSLLAYRVECNENLANHEFIQVKGEENNRFTISSLGLINGILAAYDLPLVATVYSDDDKDRQTLLGFSNYQREELETVSDHRGLIAEVEKKCNNTESKSEVSFDTKWIRSIAKAASALMFVSQNWDWLSESAQQEFRDIAEDLSKIETAILDKRD